MNVTIRRAGARVILIVFVCAILVLLIGFARASTLEVGRESVQRVKAVCKSEAEALAIFKAATKNGVGAMNGLYQKSKDCGPRNIGYRAGETIASGKIAGAQLFVTILSVMDHTGGQYYAIITTSLPNGN